MLISWIGWKIGRKCLKYSFLDAFLSLRERHFLISRHSLEYPQGLGKSFFDRETYSTSDPKREGSERKYGGELE
jgi:hypothetical protein